MFILASAMCVAAPSLPLLVTKIDRVAISVKTLTLPWTAPSPYRRDRPAMKPRRINNDAPLYPRRWNAIYSILAARSQGMPDNSSRKGRLNAAFQCGRTSFDRCMGSAHRCRVRAQGRRRGDRDNDRASRLDPCTGRNRRQRAGSITQVLQGNLHSADATRC